MPTDIKIELHAISPGQVSLHYLATSLIWMSNIMQPNNEVACAYPCSLHTSMQDTLALANSVLPFLMLCVSIRLLVPLIKM